MKRRLIVMALLLALLVPGAARPSSAQDLTDLISLSATVGYDGYYRANSWMPVRVTLENNGDAVTGRLLVRPETSGNTLTNTFSTPIDLPSGGSQVIFLYVTARSNADELRVELLDDEGRVLANHDAALRYVRPHDQLYVVVSNATAGLAVDLSTVNTASNDAVQATWNVDNIPDRAPALEAVNAMLFTDVDTGALSAAQREAIAGWVRGGGHLIVGGGAAWQQTAAGLGDLLPLRPENSQSHEDFSALADLAGAYRVPLDGQTVIATGELSDDAIIMAADDDGTPLLVRRTSGYGTVDFIAPDPNTPPLRGWESLPELWMSLMTSVDVQPSWAYGFSEWDRATDAVEILPGIDLLPAAMSLILFLLAYVLLVGPVNYLILARLNRREWAWITIPILIVVFTLLAREVGFNLRGEDVTLSRLTVVQSWPEDDEAQVDQLVGLLAPRRDNYTLTMTDDRMLRPIPNSQQNVGGVLGGRAQIDAEISQGSTFGAVDFPVDASFIAGFHSSGHIPAPAISGRATLNYVMETGEEGEVTYYQTVQGSIRNDSDLTLENPVILVRGRVYRLEGALAPGDVRTFAAESLRMSGSTVPPASPLEYAFGDPSAMTFNTAFATVRAANYGSDQYETVEDILGAGVFDDRGITVSLDDDPVTQENQRRQAFMEAFILDQYASTSRGNNVYLLGWTSESPLETDVDGENWRAVDTSLYIVELPVTVAEADARVRVSQDQFSWLALDREGVGQIGPFDLRLFDDDIVTFRFTPLPDARLGEVDDLVLLLRRSTTGATVVDIDLWDWRARRWETLTALAEYTSVADQMPNFERFIGPHNAVEVRIRRIGTVGTLFIDQLAIEQFGEF